MTIASEITDLQTNLSAAKTAVETKGGTVGDTGLAGLATEIATIPSGGASKDYGTVTYARYWQEWTANNVSMCSVVIDAELFEQAYEQHKNIWNPGTMGVSFNYSYSGQYWRIGNDSSNTYTNEQLVSFGVTVTLDSPTSSASFYVVYTYVIDPTDTTDVELHDVYEYMTLGSFASDGTTMFYVNGQAIPRTALLDYEFGEDCDFLPNNFLYYLPNFNVPVAIPSGITEIPNYFLANCPSFNSTVTIPNTVTKIGDRFMAATSASSASYTQTVTIPSSVVEIGNYFLYYQTNVTSVVLNEGLKKIGDYFMSGMSTFNSTISLPNTVESIGNSFMQADPSFNQPLAIPTSLKTIGNSFLSNCTSFNQRLVFPASLESIGNNFMQTCTSMASIVDMTFATGLKTIGNNYLSPSNPSYPFFASGTSSEKIERLQKAIPPNVETIGDCFFSSTNPANIYANFGYESNQHLSFNHLKTVGQYFLAGFRGTMVLDIPVLETLGNCFLEYSTWSGDTYLTLPSTLKTIGTYFMAFIQSGAGSNVTIPSSVTSIGGYFFWSHQRMGGKYITVECPYSVFGSASSNYILTTNTTAGTTYTTGIYIKGTYRSDWLTNLPNKTSSPYRKLMDGGA